MRKNKIRILHVAQAAGGVDRYIRMLLKYLDKEKFENQSSTVLDEPEREAGTTSIPIPQREESENIPLPDLPGQLENVQQSGNEIAERGMPT